MSAAEGVPGWARPVLEALAQASDHRDWMSRAAEIDAAYQQLSDVCRAALASDAGTPEGEPHALDCAISEVGARHGCTCGVEPLDESGAAAPDAELDGLILVHASTVHQHPQDSFALGKTHQAIRAHVAQVKREALEAGFSCAAQAANLPMRPGPLTGGEARFPAPAPGDASGEMLRCHADQDDHCEWTGCPQLRDGEPKASDRHCPLDSMTTAIGDFTDPESLDYQDAQKLRRTLGRLYRAATGEVVGTATLYDSYVGHLHETHSYARDMMIPVALVRRRDKEGV